MEILEMRELLDKYKCVTEKRVLACIKNNQKYKGMRFMAEDAEKKRIRGFAFELLENTPAKKCVYMKDLLRFLNTCPVKKELLTECVVRTIMCSTDCSVISSGKNKSDIIVLKSEHEFITEEPDDARMNELMEFYSEDR